MGREVGGLVWCTEHTGHENFRETLAVQAGSGVPPTARGATFPRPVSSTTENYVSSANVPKLSGPQFFDLLNGHNTNARSVGLP